MKSVLAVTSYVRAGVGEKPGDRSHGSEDLDCLESKSRPSSHPKRLYFIPRFTVLLLLTTCFAPCAASAAPFTPTLKQIPKSSPPPTSPTQPSPDLPQNSSVLRRWLREIPDLQRDIRNDPAFRTRIRAGYAYFPREESSGLSVGVEDVFIGRTGLTVSGEYQQSFEQSAERDRYSLGADLRYYVLPLGSYVNLAPVVGYRHLETAAYTTDGVNLGVRLMLSLSRTGAADLSLTQTWVSPGSDEEVGITTLSAGYALTRNLRISTDLQKQNAPQRRDSRVGILLEWML